MLQLSNLRAGYGTAEVLHGVSLSLAPGQRVAVLGRNGVGKTTLLRTVSGAVGHSGGTLAFGGIDLAGLRPYQRARLGIAHVPQGRDVFPKLTVAENLKVGLAAAQAPATRPHRRRGAATDNPKVARGQEAASAGGRGDATDNPKVASGQEAASAGGRIDQVLAQFPMLAARRRSRAGSLSGGQQQILALARAVVCEPKLLLLDEPSEGVGPSMLDEIIEAIDRVTAAGDVSVLIVEQNLDFARRVARQCLIMNRGEIIASADTADLHRNRDLQRKYLAL